MYHISDQFHVIPCKTVKKYLKTICCREIWKDLKQNGGRKKKNGVRAICGSKITMAADVGSKVYFPELAGCLPCLVPDGLHGVTAALLYSSIFRGYSYTKHKSISFMQYQDSREQICSEPLFIVDCSRNFSLYVFIIFILLEILHPGQPFRYFSFCDKKTFWIVKKKVVNWKHAKEKVVGMDKIAIV